MSQTVSFTRRSITVSVRNLRSTPTVGVQSSSGVGGAPSSPEEDEDGSAASEKRERMDVLPTPESPMINSFSRWSNDEEGEWEEVGAMKIHPQSPRCGNDDDGRMRPKEVAAGRLMRLCLVRLLPQGTNDMHSVARRRGPVVLVFSFPKHRTYDTAALFICESCSEETHAHTKNTSARACLHRPRS